MLYLIQYTLYAALLYSVYLLFLHNRTGHTWNRFYLVASALIPLVLPLISLPQVAASFPALQYTLPDVVISAATANTNTAPLQLPHPITIIYLVIVAVLMGRAATQLVSVIRRIRSQQSIVHEEARLYRHTGIGPGSMGRNIFFPGNDVEPTILAHELAHVRRHHTADLLLLRLLQAMFWPNIFLHFIARELRMVHEFQADADSASDTATFSNLLLAQSFGVRARAFEHTFFHHPIKRRIAMLQKKSDRRRSLIPAALRSGFAALVITTGIIYLQSCSRKSMPEPQVYTFAEVMPHADYDLPTYLGNNIKYPEDARKRNKEGRVIVKFVVSKDGEITKPEIIRSPDQALSDEALRVVSAMPKWHPAMQDNKNVPVYFTLPISFQLENNATPDAK